MRRFLIAISVVAIVVFLFAFDRLSSTAFLNLVLVTFTPSKTTEKLFHQKNVKDQDFPVNFLIGSASSSYQIEGGWSAKGKTPSIWDDFVHYIPNVVIDNTTGDVGCDSFHKYQEDISALKHVGVRKNDIFIINFV